MADPPAPPPAEAQEPANVVRIYDRDGQEHLVSPDQAVAALRTGQFGMADGDKLTVKEAGDKVTALDAAQAVDAVQSHQFRGASVGEFQDQWYRDQYESNPLHKALAFGTGTVKSLGLGFGDAGLVGAAGLFGRDQHVRELLRDQDRYLGGYRTAGEVTGMVLPALATGGGYGALRGITAGGRGLAAAAGAVERGVVSGLGRAGLAETGLLARGLGAAAGGALEMGVYGAGEATSRAVVANPGLTAEQAVAAMGGGFLHGAATGAAFGGVLGFGGGLLGAAAKGAAGGAASLAERVTGRAARAAEDTIGGQTGRLLEALAPGGVKGFAELRALKSTGANQGLLEKATAMSPEVRQEMAALIVDKLPEALGKKAGSILSHTQQAEAAALVKEAAGKAKGGLVDELSAAGVKADVPAIVTDLRAKLDPLKGSITDDAIAAGRAGDRLVSRLEEKLAAGDVKELWKQQRQLGDEVNWAAIRKGEASLTDKFKADTYFALGKELERVGTTAESLGAEFVGRWKQANRTYQAADWITKATEKGAGRDLANRSLGLSEQLGGLGGSSLGASVGGAVAGPVGAMVGSVVGGAGAALAQRLVKQYGDQVVASALRRAMTTGGDLTTVAGNLLEEHMGKAVVGYLSGAAKQAGAVGGRAVKAAVIEADQANERAREAKQPVEKRFATTRDDILAAKAALPQRQQQLAQQIGATNARVQQQALATQQRAIDYLASKIPPAPQAMNTLQPHLDKSTPPPAEMAKFLRAVRAVEDPTSVLESLQKGDITPEQVDALKVVYPEMYGQLQKQIMSEVAALGDKQIPYAKAQALSELFGVPLHPAMRPEFIAAQQAALQANEPPAQPPRRAMRPSNLAKQYDMNPETP